MFYYLYFHLKYDNISNLYSQILSYFNNLGIHSNYNYVSIKDINVLTALSLKKYFKSYLLYD